MRLILLVLLIDSSFANAETRIAVNMHGYSYHFKDHSDIVNEKHRMIGGEYCDNQGYTQQSASLKKPFWQSVQKKQTWQ